MLDLTIEPKTQVKPALKSSSGLQRILGLDIGIASCGWAIIEIASDRIGAIIKMGVWLFDVPETDKEKTPTNQIRRLFRGQRRVVHRRRQRMSDIRKLFKQHGLIDNDDKNIFGISFQRIEGDRKVNVTPWQLRAEGLTRPLGDTEFGVILYHIAKHRGFRSNAKNQRISNQADENKKALLGMQQVETKLAQYRTVGQMFATDPEFTKRQRNRNKDYSRSIKRALQEDEVRILFHEQRKLGNSKAMAELEKQYTKIAFSQGPIASSESMVGYCSLEPNQTEKRAAVYSYSFELFRFLSRLNNIRIESNGKITPLNPDQIAKAIGDFGKQKSITYKTLRDRIDLAEQERFQGITPGGKIETVKKVKKRGRLVDRKVTDYGESADIVSRTNGTCPGTYILRKVVMQAGEVAWANLLNYPEKIDEIATIISFNEDVNHIKGRLQKLQLDNDTYLAIETASQNGEFADFKGAANISSRAARKLIPVMRTGKDYTTACKEIYGHDPRIESDLNLIRNPIARKGATEVIKQYNALNQQFGPFAYVHMELARDFAKSAEERADISNFINERTEQKRAHREELAELVGIKVEDVSGDWLQRYEMYKEQHSRCPYCDESLNPRWIIQGDNDAQIDHILPWSRFNDDSFHNKVLVHTKCNQDKGNRTPHEWIIEDKNLTVWERFAAVIRDNKEFHKVKKRNLLLIDAKEVEERFRSRNLNDTRYITRVVMKAIEENLPASDGKRCIFARPGSLTDILRRCWGINGLKKDEKTGKRLPDHRHHALDALVVAATPEWMLQRITDEAKKASDEGKRPFANMPLPWKGFRDQIKEKFPEIFVARAERRRARGKGHDATIRQIVEKDGIKQVYDRRSIFDLKESDLQKIKDAERNYKLIASLREWISAGSPKDEAKLPRSPKGDIIRRVRIAVSNKVVQDLIVRGGQADRGNMVRVDVFSKNDKKENRQFYLVPIYAHQISDKEQYSNPPMNAIPNDEFLSDDAIFLWSLYPGSYVRLAKRSGEFLEGYYRNTDIATGAITISPHNNSQILIRGIGVKTLKEFTKLTANRLGQLNEVKKEARTWHGKVCT